MLSSEAWKPACEFQVCRSVSTEGATSVCDFYLKRVKCPSAKCYERNIHRGCPYSSEIVCICWYMALMEFWVTTQIWVTTPMKWHLPPATVTGRELMCGGIASFGIHQQDVDSASQSFATWLWGLGSNVYGASRERRRCLRGKAQVFWTHWRDLKNLPASTKDGELQTWFFRRMDKACWEQVPPQYCPRLRTRRDVHFRSPLIQCTAQFSEVASYRA